jgi:hypothetical protein
MRSPEERDRPGQGAAIRNVLRGNADGLGARDPHLVETGGVGTVPRGNWARPGTPGEGKR